MTGVAFFWCVGVLTNAFLDLVFSCRELADRICCFNRHFAEPSGYFEDRRGNSYLAEVNHEGETTYFDSVTGMPLFIAPRGRSFEQFLQESRDHGWPSFRDEEVVWENVRCLRNGEAVSTAGTHVSPVVTFNNDAHNTLFLLQLGHNLPDRRGNRYCINLVSIAGNDKQNLE